ncbi:unnamed protein product [Clonostachys rhizophaga]|uniref:Uncharacterized protein n=1 Tax=Clonostachys rhizophaga TaxID=160324 RepID=A0A9N9VRZ5_9HYPO|nr:unnamed protein product [Clonostachys rhizophaga]
MVPNQTQLGLVFGIWKAFNNCAKVIVDMIAGKLQDITPGGTYERVIAFFVAVKGLEYLAGILTLSEKERLVLEREGKTELYIGQKPGKPFTIVGLSMLINLVIIA